MPARGRTRRYGAGFTWQKTAKRSHHDFRKRFLTLSQAAERLMVDRQTLKRLVIFKGFYPVKPKNLDHSAGKEKTYYNAPQIMALNRDPLLLQIREYTVWRKKMTKYLSKKQVLAAKLLKAKKPQINFVPLVKERFPMFADALKSLDDALSHVALFAILPPQSASGTNIEAHNFLTIRQHQQCQESMEKWFNYVIRAHGLRKVFFSIKGIYYQAEVCGETVTWLCPYEFTTALPKQVNYAVMIAFLEYYVVHLGFVLFKLHHDLQKKEREDELKPDTDTGNTEDFPDLSEEQRLRREQAARSRNLFSGHTFFLQREVPVKHLSFMIQAFGGTIAASEDDPTITYQVVDRPKSQLTLLPTRDYVQPQWVADSCNGGKLLPVEPYAPGADLPPHLSPFPPTGSRQLYDPSNPYGDDEDDEADARRGKRQLSDSEDEAERRANETPSEDDESVITDTELRDEDDEDEDGKPAAAAPVKAAEGAGAAKAEKPKKKQAKGLNEQDLRMELMNPRDRHLYKAIMKKRKKEAGLTEHFAKRRRLIEEGKLKVDPTGKTLVPADQPEPAAKRSKKKSSKAKKQ